MSGEQRWGDDDGIKIFDLMLMMWAISKRIIVCCRTSHQHQRGYVQDEVVKHGSNKLVGNQGQMMITLKHQLTWLPCDDKLSWQGSDTYMARDDSGVRESQTVKPSAGHDLRARLGQDLGDKEVTCMARVTSTDSKGWPALDGRDRLSVDGPNWS